MGTLTTTTGWTITLFDSQTKANSLKAIARKGSRVIHRDGIQADEASTLDWDAIWAQPIANTTKGRAIQDRR